MSTLRKHAHCSLPRMAAISISHKLQLYPFIPILPNQEITHNPLGFFYEIVLLICLTHNLVSHSLASSPPDKSESLFIRRNLSKLQFLSDLIFASNPLSFFTRESLFKNFFECVSLRVSFISYYTQSPSLLNMAAANYGIQPRGNMANFPFLQANKSNQIYSSNPCLSTFNQTKKTAKKSSSVSFDLSNNSAIVSSPTDDVLKRAHDSQSEDSVSSEKIESWIQESVADIVKNLKKAPLLVQIHAEKNGFGEKRRLKFKIEKAIFENWDFLKSEWENEGSKIPDAVVFVEELEHDQENSNQELGEDGVNRVWGMVVQRKGVDCVPSCYLLKTNRICGGLGLGFCTHFCLMRVMDFRESALEQFKDCWLLG